MLLQITYLTGDYIPNHILEIMTWKELKDKISLMAEEEQRQEVAVWGENMNLMKDCSLEKTNEDMVQYDRIWQEKGGVSGT